MITELKYESLKMKEEIEQQKKETEKWKKKWKNRKEKLKDWQICLLFREWNSLALLLPKNRNKKYENG